MIISEYVKIKISKRIYKQYKNLGYIFNLNDAIYILTKDINRCSKVKVIVRCDFCHSDKVIGYDKYNININKDGKFTFKALSIKSELSYKAILTRKKVRNPVSLLDSRIET